MAGQNKEIVMLGRISGVYGIQGWVRIVSHTRPHKNIFSYSPWLIRQRGKWQSMEVLASRAANNKLTCHLAGIENRNAAQQLIGADIAIERQQLPELEQGEVYWADLQGLTVINQDDIVLGKVEYLIETGANDVLVVTGRDNRERLIPYIKGRTVIDIDLKNKILRVDWDEDY